MLGASTEAAMLSLYWHGIMKVSQCQFSCGGSHPKVDNVTIHYTKKPGDYNALALPADVMEDKNLLQFLEAFSTASFGIGSQTVTDPTYIGMLSN